MTEFIAEAEELTESLLEKLDLLKETEEPSPELINDIFRHAHTLKGISYTAGYKNLGDLAHAMEDLFNAFRMGQAQPDEESVDIIEQSLFTIKATLQKITQGEEDTIEGLDEIIARLRELSKEKKEIVKVPGIDEELLKSLTVYEEHRLYENIRRGKNVFGSALELSMDDFEERLKEIMEMMKSNQKCEVITVLPKPIEDPTKIGFEIITATTYNISEFCSMFGIEAVRPIFTSKKKVQEPAPIRSVSRTIRVDIKRLEGIMNIVGEIVLAKNVIADTVSKLWDRSGVELLKSVREMERRLFELQGAVMEARMVPIGDIFARLERDIKQIARTQGKKVKVLREGDEVEIDKIMAEELVESLMHISRNAVAHGIEPPKERLVKGKDDVGTVILRAKHVGSHISIDIEDDGKGIDHVKVFEKFKKLREMGLEDFQIDDNYFRTHEGKLDTSKVYDILFLPSFSTKDEADESAGRGVGLDVVKEKISKFGGTVDIQSDVGKGTKFSVTLPITLIIIQAILVSWDGIRYAIPLSSIHECVTIDSVEISTVKGRKIFNFRGSSLPILTLDELFGGEIKQDAGNYIIVVGFKGRTAGVIVDEIIGRREVVLKPMAEETIRVEGISGVAELGDRRLVLVLDVATLVQKAARAYV